MDDREFSKGALVCLKDGHWESAVERKEDVSDGFDLLGPQTRVQLPKTLTWKRWPWWMKTGRPGNV